MILLDALYINEGGGKILLDYIIQKFEETDIHVFYLLDERIRNKCPHIKPSNKVEFISGSLLKRHFFYKRNYNSFSKVFCFGNVPPTIYLKYEVFTYFHNLILVEVSNEYSLIQRVKFNLKRQVLKYFNHNTNFWLVQSNLTKNKLQSKLDIDSERVLVLPFYQQFSKNTIEVFREKHTYIYVSNGMPHKNHIRLINVFCEFYDRHQKGSLILTIKSDFKILKSLIDERVKEGYPIKNIGFVDRGTLQKAYLSSEFFIFPSFKESFGLGLIEAIECGCKVIGADLPYTYEVCEPTLRFDPFDDKSVFSAFEDSLNIGNLLPPSIPRIQNNINQIISLLK